MIKISQLKSLVDNLFFPIQKLQEAIGVRCVAAHLREVISDNYEIGDLKKMRKLDRGYVNTSYEIETIRDDRENRYFLRQYKEGIKEEEIRFEHSIINHLVQKDFGLVAPLVYTKEGRTYIEHCEGSSDREKGKVAFISVFEFLPGEDRYTWDNPACNDEELRNGAAVLAQYHDMVFDLNPEGRRYEPRIIDLLPLMAENIRNYAKKGGRTKFDTYFLENLHPILKAIDRIRGSIDEREYEELVHLAIHCDYHPGNLKFQNGEITGLFDFDWSKIDARCFDVALAITYFCTTWEGKEDGDLQLNKTAAFLQTYQQTLDPSRGVGRLGEIELRCLPHMIGASNIYVLNWGLDNFYSEKVNPYEYLLYLQHNVRLMSWLEKKENLAQLEKTIIESTSN